MGEFDSEAYEVLNLLSDVSIFAKLSFVDPRFILNCDFSDIFWADL